MFKLKKNKYLSFSTSLVLFGIVTVLCLLVSLQTSTMRADASADSTLYFQARLLTSAGAVVPDGSYNIEFKLYNAASSSGSSQGSCTGDSHCEWVETYTGANKVTVNDGYLSVYLGSLNAFPNTIDWEQPLYLSMNVGGTSSSPTWDGEMTPRIQLTALPYAFIAGQLAASDSSGDRATLVFPSSLSGTATITIPDVTGTICLQSSSACGFASSTGSTSYVDINPSSAQSGGFNVTGTGIVGTLQATNVQTSSLDTSSSGTLNIGQTNATGISLDKSTTDTSSLTVTGTTALNNTTSVNSASNSSALSVTNAAGTTDLNVNTSTADVGVDSVDNLTNNSSANITIGNNGTSVGQAYVSGNIPSNTIGNLTFPTNTVIYASSIQGSYEYVTGYNSSSGAFYLAIVNISNPSNPTIVGSYSSLSYSPGYHVYLSGSYAYIDTQGSGSNYLLVFNVSDPISPILISTTNVTNTASATPEMSVNGNDIYFNIQYSGTETLYVVDISSPSSPVVLMNPSTSTTNVAIGSGAPVLVRVSGRYAYAATSIDTLGVYDISNTTTSSASPQAVGSFSTAYNISSVTVSGRYAYIGETNGSAGYLQVVDISNPLNPVLAGSASTTYPVTSITISGREAYLAEQAGAIQVADISTPTSPNILSSSITATPYSLQISGRYLYVISSGTTLQVYDLGGEYTQTLQAGSTETGSLLVDNNATVMGSESVAGALQIGGAAQIDDDLSVLGATTMQGGLTINGLATPATPTVTPIGASGGSTVYSYEVAAVLPTGITTSSSSPPGVATNVSTLSSTSYNIVTWAPVPGAAGYYVYRSTAYGTLYQLGTEVYANSLVDNGSSSISSAVAPTTNMTGYISVNDSQLVTNSSTAFNIQNSSGTIVLGVNTINSTVNVDSIVAPTTIVELLAPAQPTITTHGTAGTSTYSYEVTAVSTYGAQTYSSQTGSISTGNSILTSSNYNIVTWTAETGVSYYNVYRITGASGYGAGLVGVFNASSCSTTCAFDDNGQASDNAGTAPPLASTGTLGVGTTYYYYVSALDSQGGYTAVSNTSAVVPTTSDTSVSISWSPVNGAKSYNVYRTTNTGGVYYYTVYTNNFIDTNATPTGTVASIPTSTSSAYTDNLGNTSTGNIILGNTGTSAGQVYIGGNNSSTTSLVGSITPGFSQGATDEYVRGNYDYVVGTTDPYLQIIDISNPSNPVIVGSSPTICKGTEVVADSGAIYVNGSYAYIICANNSVSNLVAVNISNPANLTLVASSPTITTPTCVGSGSFLDGVGRYIYIVYPYTSSLGVYDISSPNNPVQDYCGNPSSALSSPQALYVSGRYAYIANKGAENAVIIDISNSTGPSLVSAVGNTSTTSPAAITVQGNYMYLAGGDTEKMQIFNISNPSNPIMIYQSSATITVNYMTVVGRYLYLANGNTTSNVGWSTYDISTPANPSLISTVNTGNYSFPEKIILQGRYAYVDLFGSLNETVDSAINVYDMGGEYTQSLQAGSTETGSLLVDNNETIQGSSSIVGGLQVGGTASVNGGLSVAGSSVMQNTTVGGLTVPSTPTVVNVGGITTTTYCYEVVAVSSSGGTTAASGNSCINNASALTSTNYNIVTWAPVPGAVGYYIYRATSSGATYYEVLNGSNPLEVTAANYTDNGTYTPSGSVAAPTSDSSASFTVEDGVAGSSTATLLNVDGANNTVVVGQGSAGDANPVLLVLDNGSSAADPSTTTSPAGAMYYNSNTGNFRCLEAGTWINCVSGLIYANTSSLGTSTTASSYTFTPSGAASPANYCTPGRVISITARGVFSTAASSVPTLEVSLTLDGYTQGVATDNITLPVSVTNSGWGINFDIICDSTTTTTSEGYTYIDNTGSISNAGGSDLVYDMPSGSSASATSTQNSTVSEQLALKLAWSSAPTSSTNLTLEQLIVKGS